ncbi:2Fe-2S iron-sulfur cluster-binding protein [Flagellatimonas centrodinii]|uniref:2Fe-2S iron-sulfur cluster-binding protein n=1 Tax=Flagellatimonas centrodinii TaxID=2806210 RepID=UPI001FEF96CE|nr:2Fe-2S iron-sulfur cluster-binding protein [Flagellatimonas centrodinii]ULQ47769.1 2Fe-2S iron-sulfur cluster-binding protein [Flagellatimonas centrodinii]
MHKTRHLITLEASGQSFPCEAGDTVLRAALRAGIAFPYECNSGGCGSCQFERVSGDLEDLWAQAPGLSLRARERGRLLACQTVPKGDCTLRVRLKPDCQLSLRPTRRRATLVSRTRLTADMAEFSFRAGDPAHFLPGQYALLDLPGVAGARAYSMSNLPNDDGLWQFVIKQIGAGRGGMALFEDLQPGDTIGLDGPYGLAHLRPENDRDIVCVGGGSGISPLLSILAAAARAPQLASRRLLLFYGGRTPADLCAPALLARDEALAARVECVTAISDPAYAGAWEGQRGFVHQVLQGWLESAGDASGYDYYFCGPPPMTDALQRLLMLEKRVPTAQLHFDRFV